VGAVALGGQGNVASGAHSFAAGGGAQARHAGSFVWADATQGDFGSQWDNQFRVQASGGARFDVNTASWIEFYDRDSRLINTSAGAYLSTSGVWNQPSDRDLKENFAPLEGLTALAQLVEMPIATWNYRADDSSIRHAGPMAQDFYAAFGLGQDERHIASVDADGVALAAIQGLYALSQEQAARIETLETENAALQRQSADFEARLAALEAGQSRDASPWPDSLFAGAGILLAGLGLAWAARRGKFLAAP
jgi:hypothetical protein